MSVQKRAFLLEEGVMDYETFTNNLRCLKAYKKEKNKVKSELDLILYRETGVKGISYDRIPTSGNPQQIAINRLEMADDYEAKLKEYDWICDTIREIEKNLNRMPKELKDMLKDVFVEKMTYRKASMKYGYTEGGLWYYIRRETEKYL